MQFNRTRHILQAAISPAWRSSAWLLKLMIPITLGVNLLQYYGILDWIAQFFNPLFCWLGLPGESAVIFISGAAAGTYSGIAAMMTLHLTIRQATIIALMICLCHALPMECSVNRKTGSSFWRMAVIRIVMAFVCAWVMNMLLPVMDGSYPYLGAGEAKTLMEVLTTWAVSMTKMALMVIGIIYALMVVQRWLEEYKLLGPISDFLSPLMRIFGLPKNAAYMWLTGNVLGISYGSAVMLELKEQGYITDSEANDVNYHLIMNHSMLEDTIVFALTGITWWIILTVRITAALCVVWVRKLFVLVSLRP